jgi:hypothetical protein
MEETVRFVRLSSNVIAPDFRSSPMAKFLCPCLALCLESQRAVFHEGLEV